MQSLRIRDHGIDRIGKQEESSCESVQSISDIHTIGSRNQYKDKEWYIPHSNINSSEKWNMQR